jgi:hypothetical protein
MMSVLEQLAHVIHAEVELCNCYLPLDVCRYVAGRLLSSDPVEVEYVAPGEIARNYRHRYEGNDFDARD